MMQGVCPTCGSVDNTEMKTKTYTCLDLALGEVIVPAFEHEVCVNCGEAMSFTYAQAKYVEFHVDAQVQEVLSGLPVGDFITRPQALRLANVGAFTERRFDNFTYRFKVAGRWMYYRPSVEAFKANGDGRIPLR